MILIYPSLCFRLNDTIIHEVVKFIDVKYVVSNLDIIYFSMVINRWYQVQIPVSSSSLWISFVKTVSDQFAQTLQRTITIPKTILRHERAATKSLSPSFSYTFWTLKTRQLDGIIPTIQGIHLRLWIPDDIHARSAHPSSSRVSRDPSNLQLPLFFLSFPFLLPSFETLAARRRSLLTFKRSHRSVRSATRNGPKISARSHPTVARTRVHTFTNVPRGGVGLSTTTGSYEGSRSSVNR